MAYRALGSIAQVQIQRSSLKAGERPNRYYDPAPLLVVPRLRLTVGGVFGLTDDGNEQIDVHHADHSQSKNRSCNGISIGFTSHYQAMRERFGPYLTDGIAGENILVACDTPVTLDDLGEYLIIETADGTRIALGQLMVAAPCVEFSHFAAAQEERLPAEALKATLQFLNDGIRGFYATLDDASEGAIVQPGDRVFVAS
jgi:hypothetical protein